VKRHFSMTESIFRTKIRFYERQNGFNMRPGHCSAASSYHKKPGAKLCIEGSQGADSVLLHVCTRCSYALLVFLGERVLVWMLTISPALRVFCPFLVLSPASEQTRLEVQLSTEGYCCTISKDALQLLIVCGYQCHTTSLLHVKYFVRNGVLIRDASGVIAERDPSRKP
jgi:hypothetical protein